MRSNQFQCEICRGFFDKGDPEKENRIAKERWGVENASEDPEMSSLCADYKDKVDQAMIKLHNIVAFIALMQNGEGLMGKSPDYIMEKFNRYCKSDKDETDWGLDPIRKRLIAKWNQRWLGGFR